MSEKTATRGTKGSSTAKGRSRPPSEVDAELARLTGQVPEADAFVREYPGSDWVSSNLARSLERLGSLIAANVAAVFAKHGLSHAGGNALAVLEGAGPMTPGDIGTAMHTTSGSITSLIDTLEKRGLVRRSAHADDRRKVLVDITPEGQALLDQALPSIQLVARDLMSGLEDDDRRQLFALAQIAHRSVAAHDPNDVPEGRRHRPGRLDR